MGGKRGHFLQTLWAVTRQEHGWPAVVTVPSAVVSRGALAFQGGEAFGSLQHPLQAFNPT